MIEYLLTIEHAGRIMYAQRIISLILTLIMLITMVPSTIVAASEVRTKEGVEASSNQSESNRSEVDKSDESIIYMVNPLYEDVISIDDLKKKLDSSNDEPLFGCIHRTVFFGL